MKNYFMITTSQDSEPQYDFVQTEATPEQTKAHFEGLGEGRTVCVLTLEQIAARHELAEAAVSLEAVPKVNPTVNPDGFATLMEAEERFQAALKKVQSVQ